MPKRKPKSPWIRVYDRNGLCIQRCRDPEKAVLEFIHLYNHRGQKIFGSGNGEKITLDNIEYNPPIIEWKSSVLPIQSANWKNMESIVLGKIKFLIDIHISFYYA